MINRGVLIFPKFENEALIHMLREKYDASAKKVKPHITLVFPFESDITSDELREHIKKALVGVKPFNLSLQGITFVEERDNHLFLNICDGADEIIEMHKKLYSGILKYFHPDFLKRVNYLPHMTVGNLPYDNNFQRNLSELKGFNEIFRCKVDEIAVEYLTEDWNSIREFTVYLG